MSQYNVLFDLLSLIFLVKLEEEKMKKASLFPVKNKEHYLFMKFVKITLC